MGELQAFLAEPRNIAKLYNALMQRVPAAAFSAKTLNVAQQATDVMKCIHESARQVSVEQVEEYLNLRKINAISEANLAEFVRETLRGNINAIRHFMTELGWTKSKVKWGGVDYGRAIWVRPDYDC